MKTSLETMAKSRTCYADTPKPKSQPLLRVSSPISKSSADRKKSSSSEVSVVSSGKSSSNYQYDTPNEDPPQRIFDLRPIDASLKVENHGSEIRETGVNDLENNENSRIEEIDGESLDRSVSFPAMKKNQLGDLNDRVASESLDARMKKLRGIVATVESIGLSRSNVHLAHVDSTNATLSISNRTEFIYPAANDRQSYGFSNRPKGVKFLTLNDNERPADTADGTTLTFQHCQFDKSRNGGKVITISSSKCETIDDLIGIAENPNPSIKSIYFPPNPDDTSTTSGLCAMTRDSRNSRISSRYRSDLDALSRIQDELVPLQDKFTELAGQVRALNLTGMPYRLPIDPWIESARPSSIVSHDASGYFLHRARVFCRNDSPRYTATGDSRLTVLPIVDNSLPVTFDHRISHLWRDDPETDYRPDYSRRLQNSTDTLCAFYDNTSQSRDNDFHEKKPYDDEHREDFIPRRNDYSDRSICSGEMAAESRHDNLERYHWSQVSTLLPSEGIRDIRKIVEPSTDDSRGNVKHRVVANESSVIRTNEIKEYRRESRHNDFRIIDGKILRHANDKKHDNSCGHESSRARRKDSLSHRSSDGRVPISRSKTSQNSGHSRRDPRITKNHSREITLSGHHITSKDEMRDREECRRSRKSNDRLRSNETIHRHRERLASMRRADFHDDRVSGIEDTLLSRPIEKIGVTPKNSESLNVKTKTSIICYSRVFKPSSTSVDIADDADLAEHESIKFTDTYTEQTIVKMDNEEGLEVSDSPEPKVLSLWAIKDDHGVESKPRYDEDTRESHRDEKQLRLPISDEKITIVPVMYTSGIPEAFDKFDRTICRRDAKIKRSSDRRRQRNNDRDKFDDRTGALSARNGSILSIDGSEATTSFASHVSRLIDENSSLYKHEKSWHEGQHSRRDSRLTIAYDRSNTEISVSSSSTVNTERTMRTGLTASRVIISRRPKVSTAKRDNGKNRSPRNLRINNSQDANSRATSIRTPVNSARSQNNRRIIGMRISPDQFTDDA